jgi:hypothetical protein
MDEPMTCTAGHLIPADGPCKCGAQFGELCRKVFDTGEESKNEDQALGCECGGTGDCETCGGSGRAADDEDDCEDCDGSGVCPDCNGYGE